MCQAGATIRFVKDVWQIPHEVLARITCEMTLTYEAELSAMVVQ